MTHLLEGGAELYGSEELGELERRQLPQPHRVRGVEGLQEALVLMLKSAWYNIRTRWQHPMGKATSRNS